jgi:tetratricopeptide (TPR) repeat protein
VNDPHDPELTTEASSAPPDSLDAGLAADFGRAEPTPTSPGETRPGPAPDATPPGQAGGLPAVPGYRVLREIARGGMGRVLAAFDLTLDRDIALKVLLPGADPDRFVRESKITARLPHPGIPPVHALGTLADGSPFLAMKLIAGQTLADELKTADRPRLVQAFLQVCQAVGFAHSKGIIHRDLKPSNIMVGAFGEVQVMDWGLAKDLTRREVAETPEPSGPTSVPAAGADPNQTTEDRDAGAATAEQTVAGAVLGTPAYMAPEQARGEATDARADVFALGGILCVILTGQPPFIGKTAGDVIRHAGAADLAEAIVRLDGSGADAELVRLCRRCLSPDPADRPAAGQAVVDRLSTYLNSVQERLQAAERERAVAVAREAEQRKRRKVQLALAAALLGLMLGVGAFAWWRNEEAQAGRERDVRNAEAVAALLGQAQEALVAGDAAKAAVALEAARKRSAEGGAEQEAQRLRGLEADLTLVRELNAVDHFAWTPIGNKLPGPTAVAMRTGEALERFGAAPDKSSVDETAARVSASVVRERIVWALDRLLLPTRLADAGTLPAKEEKRYTQVRAEEAALLKETPGVRALLRRVDADAYRDAVRDVVLARDGSKMAELAGQPIALEQPPGFAAFLGEIHVIPVERRRALLEAALGRRPGDLGLLMTLGWTYPITHEDGANERVRWFQAAIAIAPGSTTAHNALGVALQDKKDLAGSEAALRKAIELDPKNAPALSNLGITLQLSHREDEAIVYYRKAIAMDPEYAPAHSNLGVLLCDVKRDYEGAIPCFRKALNLDPNVGMINHNLGTALLHKGQLDEAIVCLQKAIERDPKYARAYGNMCVALRDKGRLDEAITNGRKAVELEPELAEAQCGLGLALAINGQFDEAIVCFNKAIKLDPKHAEAHFSLGNALGDKGQLAEAIVCFNKAIKLNSDYAAAYCSLGLALRRQGRFAESLAAFKRGHELGSKQPGWHFPSAQSVREAEALVTMEAKLPAFLKGEYQPRDAVERLDLAAVCHNKNLHAAAARLTADAFVIDPKSAEDLNAGHRYNAAGSAALAAAGQGEDAGTLNDQQRSRLRKQALEWLRADVALLKKQLETGKPADRAEVRQAMRHGQTDSDLACIRDPAVLAKLPAEERAACEKLWAEVAALLKKAEQAIQEQQSAEAGKPGRILQPQGEPKVADKLVTEESKDEAAKAKLATEYQNAGKHGQALPLLVELWNSRKARLGPDHADTLESMNQLGVVYWRLGQLDKSVLLFEKLVKIREGKLGRDHPDTLQALANLGVNYKDTGKLKEAMGLLEEALPRARIDPQLGWVMNQALDAYARAGENAKFANLLPEVLPAVRKSLPPDSPYLAGLLAEGGLALLHLKKWAEAEPLLRECLTIREKTQPDAWSTFNAKSMVGGVLLGQKKYAEAEPLLLAGYEGMKQREANIPPPGRPRLTEAVERLVQLYEALGKKDDAARWTKEWDAIKLTQKKAETKP